VSQEGATRASGVFEGEILDGKYRVQHVLGAGGMGMVVLAQDIGLDHKVAIKLLLPEMLSNPKAVGRFAREARNAVRIKGQHMTRVLGVGTLATGAPYMVMEFLEGCDLHQLLQQRGPLPFDEAIDFVLQACEVAAEAHALGIVHRDFKPANLFCVRGVDGRFSVKVLDFGISKVTPLDGSPSLMHMTNTTGLLGSPFYMSPEQMIAPYAVDHRTDIWALGIIIHELLTGSVPFPGTTLPEVTIRIHSCPPVLLREGRPDAPEGLQSVVTRCLEKDREKRFANVGELARALLPFGSRRASAWVDRIADIVHASGSSPASGGVPLSTTGRSQVSTGTIAPLGATAAPGRARPKAVLRVASVALAVALAGLVAVAFATRKDGPARASQSAALAVSEPPPPLPLAPRASAPVETVSSPPQLLVEPFHEAARAGGESSGPRPATHARPKGTAWPTPRALVPKPAGDVEPPASDAKASTSPAAPAQNPVQRLDCDPNYTIDPKSGAHVFKPECFQKR
jgi:serine/threonine protein kinase